MASPLSSSGIRELADRVREVGSLYVRSAAGSRNGDDFGSVETFCLFLGHGRSGHSLVGSLLNAHRHVVVSHELDALRYIRLRFTRKQLYWMLLDRDREFEASGREWTGYRYVVPNQWQGRYEELRVIGDKKGGVSTRRLAAHPDLLDRTRRLVGVRVRVVLVVRNPYDNIATLSARLKISLDAATDQYFGACRTIDAVRADLDAESLAELRHEDLVADPRASVARLCAFLGVDAPADYLDDCASIVYDAPNRSRDAAGYSDTQRERIARELERYEFLRGYSWDS